MQTLQLGIFFGEGGMDAVSPSLLLLSIIICLYILIYTILLYILFFKTIIFFPKFNFLASYSSLFLKSNLSIFPYFGLKPKLGTQNQIPPSILVCIISWFWSVLSLSNKFPVVTGNNLHFLNLHVENCLLEFLYYLWISTLRTIIYTIIWLLLLSLCLMTFYSRSLSIKYVNLNNPNFWTPFSPCTYFNKRMMLPKQ